MKGCIEERKPKLYRIFGVNNVTFCTEVESMRIGNFFSVAITTPLRAKIKYDIYYKHPKCEHMMHTFDS